LFPYDVDGAWNSSRSDWSRWGSSIAAGPDALALDPDVQRNTYVPEPPPPGFGRTWLDAYVQARADGVAGCRTNLVYSRLPGD
jgi:hypothetical protein